MPSESRSGRRRHLGTSRPPNRGNTFSVMANSGTHRILHIDGDEVAVRDSGGDGRPIVLLHGNSLSSRSFQPQFDGPLGATMRLLAIDFPGHGKSAKPSAPIDVYSIPGLARVVLKAVERLDVSDAVFLGWSLGGHVLLEASGELPDAAGFGIFGAPPLRFPLDMDGAFHPHPVLADLWVADLSDEQIAARVASMMCPDASLPREFLDDVTQSDPRFRTEFPASLASVGFADEVRIVEDIGRPLLVLHGALDQIVRLDYLQGLDLPSLWRGQIQVIPNAAHAVHWEAPGLFDAVVREFVDDIRA